jgi:hypothetical protein
VSVIDDKKEYIIVSNKRMMKIIIMLCQNDY